MQASALEADGEMPLELTGKLPGADGDHTEAGMGNPCWITAHICIAERQQEENAEPSFHHLGTHPLYLISSSHKKQEIAEEYNN